MHIPKMTSLPLQLAPPHHPGTNGLPPFRLLTLPKSGTHLTEGILKQLGYKKLGPPHHLFYGEPINFRQLDPKVRYIAQIRDPRDIMVSLVHHIDKKFQARLDNKMKNDPNVTANRKQMKEWLENKSFDEKLMRVLTCDNSIGFNVRWTIERQFKEMQKLMMMAKLPKNVLLIRYEDLIRSEENVKNNTQIQTVQKIAKHLGRAISEERATAIINKVWGHSVTFRKGSTGEWKKAFKPEHIQEFKNRWERYLFDFGYEKNIHWLEDYSVKVA